MPPKAPTEVLRGRGRPKRQAAPEPTPVANAPAKRGRAVKADIVQVTTETPKKRGRPAKVAVEEAIAVAEAAVEAPRRGRRSLIAPIAAIQEPEAPTPKRMGRPPKNRVTEALAPTPKKRGRPARANAAIAVEETLATPKRRGRPAKNAVAVDLSRVAGSPRVTKSLTRPAVKAAAPAAAPRMNPRMRSKLRTRLPPPQKVETAAVAQPTKPRGRPAKAATKAQPPAPKKSAGRKATNAAVAKPVAPRKKRGYTALEVPDKFAAQVQQYLQELQDAESLPTPVEGEAEEVAEQEEEENNDEEDAEAEAGAEEDVEVIVEEDILATSPAGSVDQDNMLALANGEEDFSVHAESDLNAQEHVVQDGIADEQTEVEPVLPVPEVEVEKSVKEIVQVQLDADNVGALEQELDLNSEEYNNEASSFIGAENTGAFLDEPVPTPSAGLIFG
jgi:hypothetical protein